MSVRDAEIQTYRRMEDTGWMINSYHDNRMRSVEIDTLRDREMVDEIFRMEYDRSKSFSRKSKIDEKW